MTHVDPTDECDFFKKKGVFCLQIKYCESGKRTQMSEIIAAMKRKNRLTGNKYILGGCSGVNIYTQYRIPMDKYVQMNLLIIFSRIHKIVESEY
jgi:hypothetical protein